MSTALIIILSIVAIMLVVGGIATIIIFKKKQKEEEEQEEQEEQEQQEQLIADNQQVVLSNNGTVSCNTYCKGTAGSSWNSELPSDWNGAECVSTNTKYGCDEIPSGDSAWKVGVNKIECTCKKTGSGWA